MQARTGPKLFLDRLHRHFAAPADVLICNPDIESIRSAKRWPGTIIGRLDGTTYYRLTGRNLAALLRQRGSSLQALGPLLSRFPGFPDVLQTVFDRYLDRGAVWLARNARALVFQSELSLRMHEVFLAVDRRDVRHAIISNGVDIDEFNPRAATKKLHGQPAVLISASVYRLHKRLQDAVRLINRLAENFPGARLHVLGEPDVLVNEVLTTLDCERCEFHGRVKAEELPSFYAAADIQLSLSIFDPCPNVVCEGLAAGLPVLTPRQSGAAELIGEENSDWIVDEGLDLMHRELHVVEAIPSAPLDEYAERVAAIIADLRHQKEKARARAVSAMDIRMIARQYSDFVEQVRAA